jgi:hypothetical protein
MKETLKLTTILFVSIYLVACGASVAVKNNAEIKFETNEFDFGELEINADGNCSFMFSNTGDTPLVIQNVKTSCGCTVPEWPKKPIKQGKQGEILINYDTSHPGMFNKTITVFYNGQSSPQVLNIKGKVTYPEDFAENKKQ